MTGDITQGGDATRASSSPPSRHTGHSAEKRITLHEDPTSDVPEGYQRFVRTYDNGLPVTWADVPDGITPPEEMFLATQAARIYMMGDDEFDRYEAYLERDPYGAQGNDAKRLAIKAALIASSIFALTSLTIAMTTFITSGVPNPVLLVITLISAAPLIAMALRRKTGARSTAPSLTKRETHIRSRLEQFSETPRAKNLAEVAFRQLNAIRDLRESTQRAIDANFQTKSLTNTKFSTTLATTCEAAYDNLEGIVTKMEIVCPTLDDDMRDVVDRRAARRRRRHDYDSLATDVMLALRENEDLMDDIISLRHELLSLYACETSGLTDEASAHIKALTAQTKLYARTHPYPTKAD